MKIAIAADHGSFEFKEKLKLYFADKPYEIEDFGPFELDPEDDYPDFGIPAVKSIVEKKNERGILICSSGLGMCILANRFNEIRATLAHSISSAEYSRLHNDSNVLCLGTKEFKDEELFSFIEKWLETPFAGGRHERRVAKLNI